MTLSGIIIVYRETNRFKIEVVIYKRITLPLVECDGKTQNHSCRILLSSHKDNLKYLKLLKTLENNSDLKRLNSLRTTK